MRKWEVFLARPLSTLGEELLPAVEVRRRVFPAEALATGGEPDGRLGALARIAAFAARARLEALKLRQAGSNRRN